MVSYISFKQEEQGLLNGADYDLLALYFFLKQKAAFKTGSFGTFKNQRFRYIDLCAALYRPASSRRPGRDYDEAGVKALLSDLERLGLVTNRQFDGDRLTMELPLSPIRGRKAAATPAPSPVPATPAASIDPATPTQESDPFSDIPDELLASFRKSRPSSMTASIPSTFPSVDSSSVMIITDSNDSTDPIDVMIPNDLEQEYEDTIRDEIGDGDATPIEAGNGDIELADETEPDGGAEVPEPFVLVDESDADDEDEDINAPELDEWMDMLASRMSGSPPESECSEHHAPHGH
jgi:hypothetical protein